MMITIQVNPHMVASVRASKSSSRFGFFHRTMMGIAREWHHWFRQIINIDMLPRSSFSSLLNSNVIVGSLFAWFEMDFLGKFQGHITIVPELSLSTISMALSNPTDAALQHSIVVRQSFLHVYSLITRLGRRKGHVPAAVHYQHAMSYRTGSARVHGPGPLTAPPAGREEHD
jgi:hypothetical protein